MKSSNHDIFFLLAFIFLFALFYGLVLLTSSFDWTWSRILIGAITISSVTIAWSLLRKTPLTLSFREVGFGMPNWRVTGIAVVISALMLAFFPLYRSDASPAAFVASLAECNCRDHSGNYCRLSVRVSV
jgi:hypothetical protein